MYRAKEAGRHAYRFAAPNINRELHATAALAEELRASLERDELFVCYQPRIDFLTRRLVGGRSAAALAAPALRAAAAGVVPAARGGRRHRRARWARCC